MPKPRTLRIGSESERTVFLSEDKRDSADSILRNSQCLCPVCGEPLFFESESNSAGERGWLCPARFDGAHT